jgi:hypothetical protein
MKKLILLLSFIFVGTSISTTAQAAFDQASLRYISGHEIFEKLNAVFPIWKYSNSSMCSVTDENTSAIGFSSPVTGRSIYMTPGIAFVYWYQKCLEEVVATVTTNGYSSMQMGFGEQNIRLLLGPLQNKVLTKYAGKFQDVIYSQMNDFTDDEMMTIVKYNMERILGPDEVILDYGNLTQKDIDNFRAEILKEAKASYYFSSFFRVVLIKLLMRDEFLSY